MASHLRSHTRQNRLHHLRYKRHRQYKQKACDRPLPICQDHRTRRWIARKIVVTTLVVSAAFTMLVFAYYDVPKLLFGRTNSHFLNISSKETISTPKEQWHQGSVPALYQSDPAWAASPYAGGTVGENGCGPTCLAMVYIAVTGQKDQTPELIARWSDANGFVENGETTWALMTQGAAHFGLLSHEVPADANAVSKELYHGNPIICSMAPGDFTTIGHFIVLSSIDEKGNLIVRDPNSEERTNTLWNLQKILDQCRNIWAFEGAESNA